MPAADCLAVRQWTVALVLCGLCLCLQPGAGGTPSTGDLIESVMLVAKPSVSVYAPLDSGASEQLLNAADAVPEGASCAHFNRSVYCVGGDSVKTWRFDRANGSPLPPGPELNRNVYWPGNGRLANINNNWLVTCGDGRTNQPTSCQVLHVNASHWVDIESEACGKQSAVAEHNGRVFVAGGWCNDSASAAVWSLRKSRTAAGNDTFQWQRQPDMNTARVHLAIASHNGDLYACGGWMRPPYDAMSDCERWREGMHSWQSIAPLPQPRFQLHLLSVGGHLIAMGGHSGNMDYKLDVFEYNEAWSVTTWSRLHDMPSAPQVRSMHIFGSAVVPAGRALWWCGTP